MVDSRWSMDAAKLSDDKMIVSNSDFPISYTNDKGIVVSYLNLFEAICQGGPTLGSIRIGEKVITKHSFGGPLLFWEDFAVIPLFEQKRFRLSLVNLNSLKTIKLVGTYDMLLLIEIKDDHAFFYTDLYNSAIQKVDLVNSERYEEMTFRDFFTWFRSKDK